LPTRRAALLARRNTVGRRPSSREISGAAGALIYRPRQWCACYEQRAVFSVPQHQDPGVAVTEEADEPGGCHEAWQRKEGAD